MTEFIPSIMSADMRILLFEQFIMQMMNETEEGVRVI